MNLKAVSSPAGRRAPADAPRPPVCSRCRARTPPDQRCCPV